MLRYVLPVVVMFFALPLHAQYWKPVGPDALNQASFGTSSTDFHSTLDTSGQAYVVSYPWGYNGGGDISVRRYDADSGWLAVGPSITATPAYKPQIAVGRNGTCYIAYRDGPTNNIVTMRFNGTSWVTAGNTISTLPYVSNLCLTTDTLSQPYLAFVDDNPSRLRVFRLQGANWVQVGAAVSSQVFISEATMKIDPVSNQPFVCFYDDVSTVDLIVKRYDGSSWVQLGTPATGYLANSQLVFSSTGTPYLAYFGVAANGGVTVQQWDGTAWLDVGTPTAVSLTAVNVRIAIDSANRPVIGYQRFGSGFGNGTDTFYVERFDGTSWVPLDTAALPLPQMVDDMLIHKSTNSIYFSMAHQATGRIFMRRWNGIRMDSIGDDGLTNPSTGTPRLGIHKATDMPFVAYTEEGNGLRVRYFSGNSWHVMDTAGLRAVYSFPVDITVDNAATPYVLFAENGLGGARTVQKFTGSKWEDVGSPGEFGSIGTASLLQDTAGKIIIIYTADNGDINAKQLSDTGWAALGTPFPGTFYIQSAAFDKENNLHIAYANTSSALSVSKWDGATWQTLSSSGLSSAQSFWKAALSFDTADIPYLFYGNASAYAFHVRKLVNGTWTSVENSNGYPIAGWSGEDIYLGFTTENKPVIGYTDYVSTVRQYNGSYWAEIDSSRASPEAVTGTMMKFGRHSLFVSYSFSSQTPFFVRALQMPIVGCSIVTWTGAAGNNLWSDPSNWNCGVPTAITDVLLPMGASIVVDVSTASCHNLTLQPGANLSFSAGTPMLTVSGHMQNSGTVVAQGGQLQVNQ